MESIQKTLKKTVDTAKYYKDKAAHEINKKMEEMER